MGVSLARHTQPGNSKAGVNDALGKSNSNYSSPKKWCSSLTVRRTGGSFLLRSTNFGRR